MGRFAQSMCFAFFSRSYGYYSRTTKLSKIGQFGSHSTIHTFKNYFVTVFLANKRYPNTLLNLELYLTN